NDTYGHICGDEVLKIISENLQKFFRAGDAVGRLGGDEFIAFMPGVSNKQKLLEKANELCDFLNKFKYTDEKLQLSVSIGVSLSNKSSNFIELYDKADQALYEAKQAGKKQARLYEE
ncbi:MAG: GGDEF domain-containing protein, partial [Oscillospiraceae bacterium]